MRSLLPTTIFSLVALFALSGCIGGVNAKSLGAGPWDVIPEPPPLNLTADENAQIDKWAAENAALWKKIQAQDHAWRAGVQTHNKLALAHNTQTLKDMGFDKQSAQQAVDALK